MDQKLSKILVTGATGFIGAHVVDVLLARGLQVRGATRSDAKGEEMLRARPQFRSQLEFVRINDFESPGGLEKAVEGIDAVIHVASPFTYDTVDNEKELIRPAINGVKAILEAASKNLRIKRVVVTSSFASVVDINRRGPPFFTYTASDWNPITYEEAILPSTSSFIAYRGSKKFAELEAWKFIQERRPGFDLVTLCPPMTFGPVVHPVRNVQGLNETNAMLWQVASGTREIPHVKVPFWVDVRDLAVAHVEAALRPEAGGKRYTLAAPSGFCYTMAADIMMMSFPELRRKINRGNQTVDVSHGLDGVTASQELGFEYRIFEETVRDFTAQALLIALSMNK